MNFLRMVVGGCPRLTTWFLEGDVQMTMFDHDDGGGESKFPKIWPRGIWMAPCSVFWVSKLKLCVNTGVLTVYKSFSFQALYLMIVHWAPKLQFKPWMAFKSEPNDWKSNWKGPKMPVNLTSLSKKQAWIG